MFRLALSFCLFAVPAFADDYSVGDVFEDPMQIVQAAVTTFSYGQEGRPAMEVDVSLDFFNRMTILVAETGFADDSVNGERTQYVLEQGENGLWTIGLIRTDFLCRRGLNTVTWQTDWCS